MNAVVRFATGNPHKLAELEAVLSSCGYRVETAEAPKLELQAESLEAVAAAAAA
ncbi:MAG: non-canonical purine NTP pyrophosphatase, partial [Crenarchaeota archaeon]|nr:non-canonical purine NTP pyrophosphatase [Thermoproteota archaeon]